MSQFIIVINQIGVFLLILCVGVLARRINLINEQTMYSLSQITVKIALPAFVFWNTVFQSTKEALIQAIPVLWIALAYDVLLFAVSFGLEKLFSLEGNKAHVFRMCFVFGNVGLIGIPLASELYPQTAIVYINMISIIDQTLIWTYGVTLSYDVNGRNGQQKISLKRLKNMLVNPVLIAIAAGIIFVVFGLPVPKFVGTALNKVSALLMPLGLIYMGAMISWDDIKRVMKRKEIYAQILIKMILIPFLLYAGIKAIGFPVDLAGTVSITVGVPPFLVSIMLCKNNGSDYEYCIGLVMLATIACLITYPILSLLNGLV